MRDQHVKQTDCLKDRPGPFPKAFPRAVRCVRGYDERYTCESTHGGNKPGTCLLPGMCFTFWKEGFYEARQRVTDTERTDL